MGEDREKRKEDKTDGRKMHEFRPEGVFHPSLVSDGEMGKSAENGPLRFERVEEKRSCVSLLDLLPS